MYSQTWSNKHIQKTTIVSRQMILVGPGFFLFVNKEYLQYKSVFEVNFMDLYYDLLFIYAKVKQFSISLNFNCEGGENERIDHFITCLRDKFRDVWRLLRFDHWHGELFIYAGTPLLL